MNFVSGRFIRLHLPFVFIAAWASACGLVGCATPPKPPALSAYEALQRDRNLEETRRRFPDLVASAEQFGQRADKEWQSNNLEDSTKLALMAEIKLRTALARNDQSRAKTRLQALAAEQLTAAETLADVQKDVMSVTEQLRLMQQADEEKKKLTQQIAAEQDERQKLSQQLATEQKRAAAQLALRTADTVEANRYAPVDYSAATNLLAKADAEIKQGAWGLAQTSLETARIRAEKAIEISKPLYEQAAQATQNKVRDEALAREAAALPGVTVRLERRGELQRLVIAVSNLFVKTQTTVSPAKEAVLEPIARLIVKYPTYPVQVVGHTDNRGKTGELVALSQARAQSVFSSLVSKGVEARRMMVSGQGPNEPIADNKIAAGRAKNSRVEIIFLYH